VTFIRGFPGGGCEKKAWVSVLAPDGTDLEDDAVARRYLEYGRLFAQENCPRAERLVVRVVIGGAHSVVDNAASRESVVGGYVNEGSRFRYDGHLNAFAERTPWQRFKARVAPPEREWIWWFLGWQAALGVFIVGAAAIVLVARRLSGWMRLGVVGAAGLGLTIFTWPIVPSIVGTLLLLFALMSALGGAGAGGGIGGGGGGGGGGFGWMPTKGRPGEPAGHDEREVRTAHEETYPEAHESDFPDRRDDMVETMSVTKRKYLGGVVGVIQRFAKGSDSYYETIIMKRNRTVRGQASESRLAERRASNRSREE
jgi:hypothetical protein